MIKNIAIIPARGGSKGIPKKNIIPIVGKPLIAFTIDAAQKAKMVDEIFVTTDDEDIKNTAESYGAKVIMRPEDISTDEASSESALIHAIQTIQAEYGIRPQLITFLQCTSPLNNPNDIDGTVKALINQQADTAFAATRFSHYLWIQRDGSANGINHDPNIRLRRQDEELQYLEAGSVYVMKTEQFLKEKHRFFGKIAIHEIHPERVFEIDEPHDLLIAEALLKKNSELDKLNKLPSTIEAIVLDFDGVFTDNKVIVFENGEEAVICDRGDGMGIENLKKIGIPIWVFSKEQNSVLKARCNKLGIPCIHGVNKKWQLLKYQLEENGISPSHTIYLGNDINDIECMQNVGCGVAVADAHEEVLDIADLVLKNKGGDGAIRELSDNISYSIQNEILSLNLR